MTFNAYLGIGIFLILFGLISNMSIVDLTPALITQNSMAPNTNTEYTYLDMIQVLCYDGQSGVKNVFFKYAKNGEAQPIISIAFAGNYTFFDVEWAIWNKELETPIEDSGNYTFTFTVRNGAGLETEFKGNFSISSSGEAPPEETIPDESPPEDTSVDFRAAPTDQDTPKPLTGIEITTVFFVAAAVTIAYGFVKQKKMKT